MMDLPSKKRSLFGFTGLFRSSPAPADESDAKSDASNKAARTQPEFSSASAPQSPAKRASESQMAARKIIGRPQGPSSKLSQSISASDITPQPASTAVATPKRMPGDNPNKPSSSFASTVSRPLPDHSRSTNFSGAASTSRNIFRSSTLYPRPGLPTFSPRVPPNNLTQSFPPNTPGRAPRGSTPDVNGRIFSHTSSSELFPMRIASPPRHLTGEALAKEVPDDPNRTGSIYADEFLAHYCPPDLDEQQRRQFFCILDLRRLKYAADEVFTKKDWKINILNFAKEYEKSRSLIMLRYGLYEFKTVRASEAVKKEWKQKHGIPDSDDEADSTLKVNGGSKRKAEEELAPSGNALMASVSGGNKRARAPEPMAKSKRKADAVEEPDENQPSKLQKPAPSPQKAPSATKSVFETIANSSIGSSATPAKPAAKSNIFSASTGLKPKGSLGRSLFEAAPKPAIATSNIFGHLSDESKGSGNEGADEESETSTNADEDESEAQDVSQSDEAAASGGVSTPQFISSKKVATVNGGSSASSEAGESTQGRSIFERITRGSDGQPIRKLPAQDESAVFAAPAVKSRSVSPVKEQPAVAPPTNNTWNANTPIKFSAPTTTPFGSAAPKPATTSTIDFGALAAKKVDGAPTLEATKESAAPPLFGAPKKAEEAAGKPEPAPQEAPAKSANLFGFPQKTTETSTTAPSIFGGAKPPASASTAGSGPASLFGQQNGKEEEKDAKAAPEVGASTLFGAKPPAAASEAPKSNIFQQSTLFGSQNKTAPTPTPQPQSGGLFGNAQTTGSQGEKSAVSLFSTDSAKPAGAIFGAKAASTGTSTEEPAAKKFAFGGGESKSGSSLFNFGASTPAPEPAKPTETKSLFGAATTPAVPATETKSLFGTTTTPAASAPETKSLFGAVTTPAAPPSETKGLFGATTVPAAPAAEAKSIFGAAPTPAAESKPLFGNTAPPTTEAKPLFGGGAGATETKPTSLFGNASSAAPAASTPIFTFGSSQPPAAPEPAAAQPSGSIFGAGGNSSFTFSAGPSDGTINNPFATGGSGSYSAPSSFNFGSGDSQPASASFTFGSGATPTFNFGGASNAATPVQTSGSLFTFGASAQPSGGPVFSQNPPAAPIFGSSLAPGAGTSTGTNTPFTFGGASSLATTPAATTPEPSANAEDGQGTNADGDEAPQEQISLTEGGPGEEDESVVHEVRAKALKLVTGADSGDDSGSNADKDQAKKKSPWKVQGVGPLRLLKHKTTGSVRLLLRAEPRGHIALNKTVLPEFTYKAEPSGSKYVKLTTATDDGKGLETYMLQVKTPAMAQALAESLEEHKKANKKK